jgi:hypothetical protein
MSRKTDRAIYGAEGKAHRRKEVAAKESTGRSVYPMQV